MRLVALTILSILMLPVVAIGASAAAGGTRPGFEGSWTWTHPNFVFQGQGASIRPNFASSVERGYLEIGPVYGSEVDWTVDLPSSIVGCRSGQPTYAPKYNGTVLGEVTLSGSCVLGGSGNTIVPIWQSATLSSNGPATVRAGPMRGEGIF